MMADGQPFEEDWREFRRIIAGLSDWPGDVSDEWSGFARCRAADDIGEITAGE